MMIEDATKWHSVIFKLSLFDQQEHLLIEKWAYILTTSRVACMPHIAVNGKHEMEL